MRRYLTIACVVGSTGCIRFPDSAAVVAVNVDSVPIYFKSYKWGRNGYSAVLSLDRSSTRVPKPDGWDCCRGDYRWTAGSPPLPIMKVVDGALHVWDSHPGTWEAPREGRLGQLIQFHEVDVLTESRMRENPERFGVSVLDDTDLPYAEPPVEPVAIGDVVERSARRSRAPR